MLLITGGAGFIGSHSVLAFIEAGYEVLIIDNFSNSKPDVIDRISQLSGKKIQCIEGDINDEALLREIFENHKIEAVVHFAGSKAVGESVQKPLMYYQNNVSGTVTLCTIMQEYGVKNLVFSSSATVYGDPDIVPIPETHPTRAVNPYGRTKLFVEEILQDLSAADSEWSVSLLRYFNPVGAHESGLIGEDPQGIPNNLVPYIMRVATGLYPHLNVFGDDYDTPDGTGVRDYIHVTDLAMGHVKALGKALSVKGCHVYNLGTGMGYSVLDLVKTFEKVNQVKVPYQIAQRRAGDVASCWADSLKAKEELGWQAFKTIEEMCKDAWRWQKNSEHGKR